MLLLGMQCEPLNRSHRTEVLAHHWACGMILCGFSGNILAPMPVNTLLHAQIRMAALISTQSAVRVQRQCPCGTESGWREEKLRASVTPSKSRSINSFSYITFI